MYIEFILIYYFIFKRIILLEIVFVVLVEEFDIGSDVNVLLFDFFM